MRFLVFQHLDVEHPGIFRDLMRARNIAWDIIAWDRGQTLDDLPYPIAAYSALLVMGGPMDVWEEGRHLWLPAEKAAIRDWILSLKKPYLGVCLGHQLLAEAMAGTVQLMKRPEVGLMKVKRLAGSDDLFKGLPEMFGCVQWHGAEVAKLPKDAIVLAESAECRVQAMRVGICSYGIQFHVEVTQDTIKEWGRVPEYAAALERAIGEGAIFCFDQEVAQNVPSLNCSATTIFKNFVGIVALNSFS